MTLELGEDGIDLESMLEEIRERYMREALERRGGVQSQAARLLGMSFRSFRYFAKKYDIVERSSAVMVATAGGGTKTDDEVRED